MPVSIIWFRLVVSRPFAVPSISPCDTLTGYEKCSAGLILHQTALLLRSLASTVRGAGPGDPCESVQGVLAFGKDVAVL